MNLHPTWIDIAPMMEMESLSKVSHVLLDASLQGVGSSGTIQPGQRRLESCVMVLNTFECDDCHMEVS